MAISETVQGSCARLGHPAVPECVADKLRRRFGPKRLGYIARVLTPAELVVLGDVGDALIVARIKRMPGRRLARFDRLVPAGPQEQRQFHAMQLQWLRDEEYLLGTRLGRRPTQRELISDFARHRNGARFRAYFTMKYPQKMRLAGRRSPAPPPSPTSELPAYASN